MDIITTPSMEEIIRQNKFQMRFLYKFSLKKMWIKMMVTEITCSML